MTGYSVPEYQGDPTVPVFLDHEPCEAFCTVEDVRNACGTKIDPGMSDEDILDFIRDATELLWYLTARQYGRCTQTVRPCIGRDPYSWDHDAATAGARGCSGCGKYQRINLGLWPINEVAEVRIDGEIVDPSGYHVENYRWLVKTPTAPDYSDSTWPTCSHQNRGSGAPGTFEVDVVYGIAPPRILVRATRRMTCELIAMASGRPCSLPERVTSVTSQGISAQIQSTADVLLNGDVGIYEVDLAIKTLNPNRLQSPSFVINPGSNRRRRV